MIASSRRLIPQHSVLAARNLESLRRPVCKSKPGLQDDTWLLSNIHEARSLVRASKSVYYATTTTEGQVDVISVQMRSEYHVQKEVAEKSLHGAKA